MDHQQNRFGSTAQPGNATAVKAAGTFVGGMLGDHILGMPYRFSFDDVAAREKAAYEQGRNSAAAGQEAWRGREDRAPDVASGNTVSQSGPGFDRYIGRLAARVSDARCLAERLDQACLRFAGPMPNSSVGNGASLPQAESSLGRMGYFLDQLSDAVERAEAAMRRLEELI